MKINIGKLKTYKEKKLLRSQSHPSLDLLIWNYTQSCQFNKGWDDITLGCRGLITDLEGNIIARPYDKFFNVEEHESEKLLNIPKNEEFIAYDKFDGSLGISYPVPGGYSLATRGSFESEQALYGTKMLSDTSFFKEGFTYLFEIIYPENRIVVDYGDEKKLVLLGARNIETGELIKPNKINQTTYEVAKIINDFKKPRDNSEGVVLYYNSGFLCKVKYDEYVRLHRLVTGVTKRRIWDLLRNGEDTKELLERVPEEFEKWVNKTIKDLNLQYSYIEVIAEDGFINVKKLDSRKEQAIEVMRNYKDVSGIVFSMLDEKSYKESIWKMIKPKHEIPFKEEL